MNDYDFGPALAVADIAEAYHRLKKELRKEGVLTKELEAILGEQWWEDVKDYF